MEATLSKANVTYDVIFKKPLLDRPPTSPALLQLLYDALSENFAISLSDVLVNQAAAPSQTFIAYRLFGGVGSIEVRAEGWRGNFMGLISQEDIKTVQRCLNTASVAIEQASDRLAPGRATIVTAGWFKCDVDLQKVAELIGHYWLAGNEMESGFLGAEQAEVVLTPQLKNTVEGWNGSFYIQASALEGTQLFMNYTGTYFGGGRYNSLDQQADHVRVMLTGMLKKLGFETLNSEAGKHA